MVLSFWDSIGKQVACRPAGAGRSVWSVSRVVLKIRMFHGKFWISGIFLKVRRAGNAGPIHIQVATTQWGVCVRGDSGLPVPPTLPHSNPLGITFTHYSKTMILSFLYFKSNEFLNFLPFQIKVSTYSLYITFVSDLVMVNTIKIKQ